MLGPVTASVEEVLVRSVDCVVLKVRENEVVEQDVVEETL